LSLGLKICYDLLQGRQHHRLPGLFQGEGHGRVVDILGGQAEVDELLVFSQAQSIEDLLDVILHRLDIVVGGFFDLLDPGRIRHGEGSAGFMQTIEYRRVHTRQLGQGQPAQGNEVFDLHPHPVADQGAFAEIVGQGGGGPPVSAVHRGNGGQGGKCHGDLLNSIRDKRRKNIIGFMDAYQCQR
jgi:hypothetical protein